MMITDFDFIPKCMKISVLFINALYWFLGIVGIGVGLYVHTYQIVPIQQIISVQFSPALMLVLMEALLFATAMLGFIGTLRENVCFLRWYLVILLLLLMVHIAMGVVAFVVMFSPPTVHFQIEEMLQNAIITYKDDDQAANYIDKIQTMVQCCGVSDHGYKDWLLNPYFACSVNNYSAERCGVPASCCRFALMEKIDTTCGFGITQIYISQLEASSVIFTQGCAPKAEEIVRSVAELLCFSAFGIATTIICGIVLSSRMVNTLQMEINDYWKQYNFENNMLHYNPNSGIYHLPEPETMQFNTFPSTKHRCIMDSLFNFHNPYYIM